MITLALLLLVGGLTVLGSVVWARWLDGQKWSRSLVAYRLGLPVGLTADEVAAWLGHVVSSTHAPRFGLLTPPPVALEVSADASGIRHTLLVTPGMAGAVLSGLRAAAPGVRVEPAPEYLAERPLLKIAAEGRLSSLSRPLAHERASRTSVALLAALQPLAVEEQVILQWIFVGAKMPSPVSARGDAATVLDLLRGEGPTVDSEALRAARLKQQDPLLQAVVRLGVSAGTKARTYSLFGWVWGCLRGLNAPGVQLVRRSLASTTVARRLMELALPITAWPLVMNTRELPGLLGLPLTERALPGLPRAGSRQLPPPVALPTQGTVIAMSTYPGMTERPLAVRTSDRLRHTAIIGPTGVGKSTLMTSQVVQDMAAGRGVAVIDSKSGDLITEVLARVPEERRDDVVLIDPSRIDQEVVGLNVLQMGHGEQGAELAVDHLVHVMSSLWSGSFGPRTSDVLRNSLLTLTHSRAANGQAFTLVELPELLLNPAFRRYVISQPTIPPTVRSFWQAFELMSEAERAQVVAPSLNKLRSFTTRTALRLTLGQSEGIRLDEVFTKRRIVLVSLPVGLLGAETAALAGSLIMSALWQATLGRAEVAPEQRHPVMLYLDEFASIVRLPLGIADMLAQSRSFGVGVVLGFQVLGQLGEAVRSAVLGTVRTQIAFQLEHDDAKALAQRFAPLTAADLSALGAFEIAMRPCVDGATLGPVTGRTLPPSSPTTDAPELAQASRERFGLQRAEIEAALEARITPPSRRQLGRSQRAGDQR